MNLTLDDYRRVLLWAGWENQTYHKKPTPLWNKSPLVLSDMHLLKGELSSLLLLDHSVLEKVRTLNAERRNDFGFAYSEWLQSQYATDLCKMLTAHWMSYVPGSYTRAALNAGLVTKEEKRDG